MASLDPGHSLCDQCISVLHDDLQCCICLSWVNKQCFNVNNNNVSNICDATSHKCKNCIELFPLNFVDDDEFFYQHSNVNINYLLDESRLELIKYDYHEDCEFDNNIDPDNSFNINLNCKYYTEYKFTQEINKFQDFYNIHFACRSLSANFKEINICLQFLKSNF